MTNKPNSNACRWDAHSVLTKRSRAYRVTLDLSEPAAHSLFQFLITEQSVIPPDTHVDMLARLARIEDSLSAALSFLNWSHRQDRKWDSVVAEQTLEE